MNRNMKINDDRKALAEQKAFVAVDVETTGLNPKSDDLLEIAAVMVSSGEVVASLSMLIQHEGAIPPEAAAVNGISPEMVLHAVPLKNALNTLLAFISDLPVVGHNVAFDVSFLEAALGRTLDNPLYCTSSIARRLFPPNKSSSLRSVCAFFGIANTQAHRALGDASATAEAALALVNYGRNAAPMHRYIVIEQNTYNIRNTLKSLGFIWDNLNKKWHIAIPEPELATALTNHGEKGIRIYGIQCIKDGEETHNA